MKCHALKEIFESPAGSPLCDIKGLKLPKMFSAKIDYSAVKSAKIRSSVGL